MNHLSEEQLLPLLETLMAPKGMTEAEYDQILYKFCAGCPDPIYARWLIVECLDPMSDEEIVRSALERPLRRMNEVPFSELPRGHPLRNMAQ